MKETKTITINCLPLNMYLEGASIRVPEELGNLFKEGFHIERIEMDKIYFKYHITLGEYDKEGLFYE